MEVKIMKAMVCEMCGSNNLVKQNGLYVCQSCNTKYTVEEAKKLIGIVKIDKTEEKQKYLLLARRAHNENNVYNAERYYSLVLQEDPNNWEATFFQVYYQSLQFSIIDIPSVAFSFSNGILSSLVLISSINDYNEKISALDTVIGYSFNMAGLLTGAAINHFNEFSTVANAMSDCSNRVASVKMIFQKIEEGLKHYFPNETHRIKNTLVEENKFLSLNRRFFNNQYIIAESTRITKEIKQYDPSYKTPITTDSFLGCYIATAVYGSYDCPEVWTLRRYRDDTLAQTWYGRAFIHTYYAISPTLVKWFGNTAWFKNMWKPKLDRMVNHLKDEGVSDKPYNDRYW